MVNEGMQMVTTQDKALKNVKLYVNVLKKIKQIHLFFNNFKKEVSFGKISDEEKSRVNLDKHLKLFKDIKVNEESIDEIKNNFDKALDDTTFVAEKIQAVAFWANNLSHESRENNKIFRYKFLGRRNDKKMDEDLNRLYNKRLRNIRISLLDNNITLNDLRKSLTNKSINVEKLRSSVLDNKIDFNELKNFFTENFLESEEIVNKLKENNIDPLTLKSVLSDKSIKSNNLKAKLYDKNINPNALKNVISNDTIEEKNIKTLIKAMDSNKLACKDKSNVRDIIYSMQLQEATEVFYAYKDKAIEQYQKFYTNPEIDEEDKVVVAYRIKDNVTKINDGESTSRLLFVNKTANDIYLSHNDGICFNRTQIENYYGEKIKDENLIKELKEQLEEEHKDRLVTQDKIQALREYCGISVFHAPDSILDKCPKAFIEDVPSLVESIAYTGTNGYYNMSLSKKDMEKLEKKISVEEKNNKLCSQMYKYPKDTNISKQAMKKAEVIKEKYDERGEKGVGR